jgi:hypothetical protein
MKKVFGILAGSIVALVVIAGTSHAAAGPLPHADGQCVACALCEWLFTLVH